MSGRLGTCVTQANINNELYVAPETVRMVTLNIMATNTSQDIATIYVAISTEAIPNMEDWVEYGSRIPAAGGVYERSCFLLSASERIIVRSDIAGVVFRVNGIESL